MVACTAGSVPNSMWRMGCCGLLGGGGAKGSGVAAEAIAGEAVDAGAS
jgi:hypothetical protein